MLIAKKIFAAKNRSLFL